MTQQPFPSIVPRRLWGVGVLVGVLLAALEHEWFYVANVAALPEDVEEIKTPVFEEDKILATLWSR